VRDLGEPPRDGAPDHERADPGKQDRNPAQDAQQPRGGIDAAGDLRIAGLRSPGIDLRERLQVIV
jgi:hypothetical protein